MPFMVLVPHDFSDVADAALDWALELVRSAGGSVRLVHVVPLPPPMVAPIPAAVPYPSEEELREVRASLASIARHRGIESATDVIVAPDVGAAVVADAAATKCNLIVMGTHGRGGVKRAVLGSVADHVIRHANCPVLTVRGKK